MTFTPSDRDLHTDTPSRLRKASWGIPSPNFLIRLAPPGPVWGTASLRSDLPQFEIWLNRSFVRDGRTLQILEILTIRYSTAPCLHLFPKVSLPYCRRCRCLARKVSIMDFARSLLTDTRHTRWLAPCLIFADAVLCAGIITKVSCWYPGASVGHGCQTGKRQSH